MVEKPIGELSLFSVLLGHSAPGFTRDFILCVITHDVTINVTSHHHGGWPKLGSEGMKKIFVCSCCVRVE